MAAPKKPEISKKPALKMPVSSNKAMGKNTSGDKMTEAAKDMKMTALDDPSIIADILTTEKGLVKRYSTALTEISCDKLRTLVCTKLSECANDQFDAFLYMNERNLYPTENAPPNKVTQAKQKFEKSKQKMK